MDVTQIPGADELGELLREYRLRRTLSESPTSAVYLATQVKLGRDVALKVLRLPPTDTGQARERFQREVTVTARLAHPSIVPVHVSGERGGICYVVMQYIDGPTLAQALLARRRLELAEVVGIVTQVAAALGAAHRAGVVHRNVKPSNILSSRNSGQVYLCDFGIAKQTHATAGSEASALTVPGQSLGTPAYMAPEQIRGEAVDPRTDEYALACVAYECLTGAPPFPSRQTAVALAAHLHQPPPRVTDHVSSLSPVVADVLVTAMAKNANERYPDCETFAAALGESARQPRFRGVARWSRRPSTRPHPKPDPTPDPGSGPVVSGDTVREPVPLFLSNPPATPPKRRRLLVAVLATVAVLVVLAAVAAVVITR